MTTTDTETVERKQGDPGRLLNAAFAKAQGEFPAIPKDRKVTVRTKTGGSYEFSYAPLDTILTACRPVLTKHGLAVTQLLEQDGNGRPSIRTELRHSSGGVVGSSFPLPRVPDSPQELGSMLTYLRRYALVALLGIATEEDDDGNHAAGNMIEPSTRYQPAYEPEPEPEPDPRYEPRLTPEQRKMLFALFNKSEFIERSTRLAWATAMIGRKIESSNDLTRQEASRLIDVLQGRYGNKPDPFPFGELPEDY